MKPIFPQLETRRMRNILRVALAISLTLWAVRLCHAQSFTITPDPVTKIKGVSGWSGSSVTYNPSDRSFSAKDGLYIPDAYNVAGGFYVEAQIWITGSKGELFTKAGTCSYGIDYQKLLCNYAPTGSDKCYGLGKIPLNKWVTVGFGVDTVGRTVFKIDSIPDLTRNMVFSGPMPQTTNTNTYGFSHIGREHGVHSDNELIWKSWCRSFEAGLFNLVFCSFDLEGPTTIQGVFVGEFEKPRFQNGFNPGAGNPFWVFL